MTTGAGVEAARVDAAALQRLSRRLPAAAVSTWRDRGLRRSLAIVVVLRVVLGVAGWIAIEVLPRTSNGAWAELEPSPGDAGWALLAPWEHWDALWYQHLATAGYRPGAVDAAFFPLYPLLTHVSAMLLGIGPAAAGLLVSTVAMAGALWMLHRLVRTDVDEATADRAVLYAAIFPTAFFLLAPFSEALFLLLSVGAVAAARRRRFAAAGMLAGVATLTRPVGVLLLAPLAVEVAADVLGRRRDARRIAIRPAYALTLLPLAALGGWNLYVVHVLHVPGGLAAAESPWRTAFVPIWTALADTVRMIHFDGVELVNPLAAVALPPAVALMAWRRLPWSYTAYGAASILPVSLHEAMGQLQSSARYLALVFPLAVVLAVEGRRPWVHRTLVAGMGAAMLALFFVFAAGSFVG